jgi:hypothetical protein
MWFMLDEVTAFNTDKLACCAVLKNGSVALYESAARDESTVHMMTNAGAEALKAWIKAGMPASQPFGQYMKGQCFDVQAWHKVQLETERAKAEREKADEPDPSYRRQFNMLCPDQVVKALVYQDHLARCWYAYAPHADQSLDAEGSIGATTFDTKEEAEAYVRETLCLAATRPRDTAEGMKTPEEVRADEAPPVPSRRDVDLKACMDRMRLHIENAGGSVGQKEFAANVECFGRDIVEEAARALALVADGRPGNIAIRLPTQEELGESKTGIGLHRIELLLDDDDYRDIQAELAHRAKRELPPGESNEAGAHLAECVRDIRDYRDII